MKRDPRKRNRKGVKVHRWLGSWDNGGFMRLFAPSWMTSHQKRAFHDGVLEAWMQNCGTTCTRPPDGPKARTAYYIGLLRQRMACATEDRARELAGKSI